MKKESKTIGINPAAVIASYQGISMISFAATKVMFTVYNHYWNDALNCMSLPKS